MISTLATIPAMILMLLLIAYFFVSEEKKNRMEELFELNTVLVSKVFLTVVFVAFGLSLLNFILPLSSVVAFVHLIETVIGIIWFIKCLFSGKVGLWYTLLKNKVLSFGK